MRERIKSGVVALAAAGITIGGWGLDQGAEGWADLKWGSIGFGMVVFGQLIQHFGRPINDAHRKDKGGAE